MKKGFTLAEVLITLGVIGVVAALTLPSVIQNHRQKAVETKLAKFYSMVNQAIQRSELDNGETKTWYDGYSQITDEFINKYFMPYFNGATYNEENKSITFADGTGMMFYDKYGKDIYFCTEGSLCSSISRNVSGSNPGGSLVPAPSLESDTSVLDTYNGKKIFAFTFAPAYYGRLSSTCLPALRPGRNAICSDTFESGSGIKKGIEPQYFDVEEDTDFAQLVQDDPNYITLVTYRNGWKVPKGYPIKF